jgi:hypothetical protein
MISLANFSPASIMGKDNLSLGAIELGLLGPLILYIHFLYVPLLIKFGRVTSYCHCSGYKSGIVLKKLQIEENKLEKKDQHLDLATPGT